MDLAFYDLKLHRGRFIATVIGVGLLFTIVLAMNGLYRGNIYEGTAVIKATNPDLWVVERYRGGPFNEQSSMPEYYHYSVKAVPGVEQASPFIYYTVERQVGGPEPAFQHYRLRCLRGAGRAAKDLCRQEYRAAPITKWWLMPKLGVKLGDRVPLGLHTYTVVGLTRGSARYERGAPGVLISA